jgi:ubiquinone/menaquinone biosynthesis C-methylase UbiE
VNEREVTAVPTKDGYDRWSEIYEEDGNPLILLEESHVARVLGNVAGLSIVDVGCGTGRHAVRLAQMGAKVTGIDFSTGMLARARSKPGADAVTFVEQDIRAAFPFDAGSFDRVLSCLVLDHVVDLTAFFAELRRVCKPDGFVVTSVMHPAMVLKGIQARFTDPSTGAAQKSDLKARPIRFPTTSWGLCGPVSNFSTYRNTSSTPPWYRGQNEPTSISAGRCCC